MIGRINDASLDDEDAQSLNETINRVLRVRHRGKSAFLRSAGAACHGNRRWTCWWWTA